jgi:prophage regulatory protein
MEYLADQECEPPPLATLPRKPLKKRARRGDAKKARAKPTPKSARGPPEELAGRYFSDVELARRYDVARVTIWRWSSQGVLPKPVAIGPNSSRWVGREIEAREARWLAAREKRFGKPLPEVEHEWVGESPLDTPPAPTASSRKPSARKPRAKPKPRGKSARRVVTLPPQAEA